VDLSIRSNGVVVPVTLELDESRWELGAFRMTNAQRYRENEQKDPHSIRRVATQHLGNRLDGIPVAGGHWDTVEPVQRTEESDDLHMPPVRSDDEPVSPLEDLHQPWTTDGKAHGCGRRQARALGQHADEADNTSSHRLSLKGILRNETRHVAAPANNDLGGKWKFACHCGACLSLSNWSPKDQRARRANIDGAQVLQRFGQLGRPERPVTSDVHPPQKNNECHSIPLNESARELTFYRRGPDAAEINREYAAKLRDLARKLDRPSTYVEQIR
jgi:hypothetical protein